jgi:hypothetical protein
MECVSLVKPGGATSSPCKMTMSVMGDRWEAEMLGGAGKTPERAAEAKEAAAASDRRLLPSCLGAAASARAAAPLLARAELAGPEEEEEEALLLLLLCAASACCWWPLPAPNMRPMLLSTELRLLRAAAAAGASSACWPAAACLAAGRPRMFTQARSASEASRCTVRSSASSWRAAPECTCAAAELLARWQCCSAESRGAREEGPEAEVAVEAEEVAALGMAPDTVEVGAQAAQGLNVERTQHAAAQHSSSEVRPGPFSPQAQPEACTGLGQLGLPSAVTELCIISCSLLAS